jgi:hypothetical protein
MGSWSIKPTTISWFNIRTWHIYQQWVGYTWDICDNDLQPPHQGKGRLSIDPHLVSQTWKGKTKQGVKIHTHHWKLHLWGPPSHFLVLYPLTPNPCPRGYMIGCRVRVFPLKVYRNWTLAWTSISVGTKQCHLPKIKRPHFRYASFTPLVRLGLDLN